MHWLFLAFAVLFETIAFTALQASHQFTKVVPSLVVAIGYGISFYLLAVTLKFLPAGIVYAMWSGLGICFISLIGFLVFGQKLDLAAVAGIGLIMSGILVINLLSKTATH